MLIPQNALKGVETAQAMMIARFTETTGFSRFQKRQPGNLFPGDAADYSAESISKKNAGELLRRAVEIVEEIGKEVTT